MTRPVANCMRCVYYLEASDLRRRVTELEGALRRIMAAFNVTPSGQVRSVRGEKLFDIYDEAKTALRPEEDGE